MTWGLSRPQGSTAKGRRIGQPSVVDADKLVYAVHLREQGDTIVEIVTKTGITRCSPYPHLPTRGPDPLTVAVPAPADREPDTDPLQYPAGAAGAAGSATAGHRPYAAVDRRLQVVLGGDRRHRPIPVVRSMLAAGCGGR